MDATRNELTGDVLGERQAEDAARSVERAADIYRRLGLVEHVDRVLL